MKKIISILIILVTGIILGGILLILVYKLPIIKIENNVKKSIDIFNFEGTYPYTNKYENSKLDNFTDIIMLQNASYNGNESIISKAMHNYRFKTSKNPLISLNDQVNNRNGFKKEYGRYWHGYLLILKPLLLFFNYHNIRIINKILESLLIMTIIYVMAKKNLNSYILPYIISIIMINPLAIYKSLQFSTIFYIFNFSMLLILFYNDKLKNKYPYYFLIFGMITSYFDFLTYPSVTLGVPLVLYCILNEKKKLLLDLKNIFINCITWIIGYIGMWLGKFILASILLKENFFNNALNAFFERTSNQANNIIINTSMVIEKNISNLIPINILLIFFILTFIYNLYKYHKKINIKIFINIIPYLFICTIPFIWYSLTNNHSYIHNFFTYRTLITSIFSILVAINHIKNDLKTL